MTPQLYYRNGKSYLTPQPEGEPRCYRVIRFYRNGRPRTIKQSLTLAEARAHCSREDTHGDGWFDGYDYMKGCKP